jgi:hypothetical protein
VTPFAADPAMLKKASVSVALVGKDEYKMIRKTIKLDQPDHRTGGCCGSEGFGSLSDAIKQLGTDVAGSFHAHLIIRAGRLLFASPHSRRCGYHCRVPSGHLLLNMASSR